MHKEEAVRNILVILFISLMLLLVVGCSGSRQVTRMSAETVTDLSGNWNDTDARLVAEEQIEDCLSSAWITEFASQYGRKPVVTVGTIRNNSSEHIDTETFTTDFERELINSGQIKFVAAPRQRDEIRNERMEQQQYASDETAKRLAQETGADFMLKGGIKSITDQISGKQTKFYQVDLELINIENNEKVWIGSKEIKKGISQGKTKW
jgi:penicillin-binding protein activator